MAAYTFGPFLLDLARHQLLRDGREVRLTPKSFELLRALVEARGALIEKDAIMQRVWPETFVDESSLTFHIHQLRKALGDNDADARLFIETVPRRGYRFSSPVSLHRNESAEPSITERSQLPTDETAPASIRFPKFSRRYLGWGLVLAALTVVSVGLIRWSNERFRYSLPPGNIALQPRRSVAILDLKNASDRHDLDWASSAVADMLSTEIGVSGKVRVISRDRIEQIQADGAIDQQSTQWTSRLGADLVLVGSLTSIGDEGQRQLRIDIRAQDLRSGEVAAAIAETGEENELFLIVSRLGVRLRDKLLVGELSLADAESLRASLPSNPNVRKRYAIALAKLRLSDAQAARSLLLDIVHDEPRFALAYARLSEAWIALGYDAQGLATAKQAFDLSGGLSQEYRLLVEAAFRRASNQWALAADVWRRLLVFLPDDVEYALQLAEVQVAGGQPQAALTTIQDFRRWPSPLGDDWRLDLMESSAAYALGDLPRSLEAAERAKTKAQSEQATRALALAQLHEARTKRGMGHTAEAITEIDEARRGFARLNDLVNAAAATVELANFLRDGGHAEKRQAWYEEARKIYQQIGNKKGEAQVLNNLAGLQEDRAELDQAKAGYEASLAIRREIDDRRGIATALNNLGDVCEVQADLACADRLYREALTAFERANQRTGIALALAEIGGIHRLRGDLTNAREFAQRSVNTWRGMKNQTFYAASALTTLGDVLLAGGAFAEASAAYDEAITYLSGPSKEVPANEARLHLAELLIEEGRAAEAESVASAAKRLFERAGQVLGQIGAAGTLAKALLAQGKIVEASGIVDAAIQLQERQANRLTTLDLAVLQARVRAQTRTARDEAVKSLQTSRQLAVKYGSLAHRLKIDLALFEIQLPTARPSDFQAGETFRREAEAHGFVLISRKMRNLLRTRATETSQ